MILEKNCWKIYTKIFLYCSISHENQSLSHIFCSWYFFSLIVMLSTLCYLCFEQCIGGCFCMAAFCMVASWMAASDLWSLQNSFRMSWMLRQLLLLTYWLPKHPVFCFTPSTVNYATFGYLPLTLHHLCDIMPCHWSSSASHITLP